ncbi:FliI/YscN family ATPase [Pseudobacteriovorax antillogorgiicola]|uniref:Type III secretion system ATPase, FliI/YscN n=1 Tax=Pseudobacteriovorax antillogorgiicola TaxID=1513793 RepID=A0A1Y6CR19_9BACT|nr:FliI/YscN family ATPase [Pseudobacteriovorax antillogorgiicola]TCS46117.1 type III secretion system FliI/YscN family ATPase [Pseudobacteriovorax antillogorgiicola]SMF69508.1 type III secretion system ATPase, FliI/YscN [Pseudobacteriovorax antillogorgiicola]
MSQPIHTKSFNSRELKSAFRKINWSYQGQVCEIVGTIVEAILPNSQLGTIVEISSQNGRSILAEVVGFRKDRVLLLPYTHLTGIAPGARIQPLKSFTHVPVGQHLLGQVLDAFMNPLTPEEEHPQNRQISYYDIDKECPNPLERKRIEEPLGLGVRAIDGLLTFGQGQRIGIMAGSGVGKSVLMGMIAKDSDADVNVIALIGERGREVREFIERDLGPEGLKNSVVIAVTSDQSPLMRIRGAKVATSIAEYFSDQGKNVMLMIDSLTRVAMAQREIGNSIGEPPTTKGYTPSVFSLLPKLLERAGPQPAGAGSISGLYTVLVDGDDFNDPIADAVRSILDGHINLSRDLASKGHFPAIDIPTSASRVMTDVVSDHHLKLARKAKELIATYNENFDLVQIGAYQEGSNPKLDEALTLMPFINQYLKQSTQDHSDLPKAIDALARALSGQPIHQLEPIADYQEHS